MITHVYFIRHAHSIYTPDELVRPLSERGFQDTKKLTQLFKGEAIDQVISSPYKRAIQTVEGIAEDIGKEVILIDDFRERRLSKVPVDDFNQAITTVWNNQKFSFPGGESNESAQKRGVKAFKQALTTYRGQKIVIGTHGNIMVLIMNYFNKMFGFDFWKSLDMPDIYKLSFENDEITEWQRIWNSN